MTDHLHTPEATVGPGHAGRTEVGVTWAICKDWAKASAETWFRVDELTVP